VVLTVPLTFKSISHATVAFGFFHIESDMLLLDRLFFFADAFCETVSSLAACPPKTLFEDEMQGFYFPDPKKIGDLMAAIHGIRFLGFIGSLYRQHPFPGRPEQFKQKPIGRFSRQGVVNEMGIWAEACRIPFRAELQEGPVSIGVYRFEKWVFWELIDYVWRGGYPRWEADIRPPYVLAMKNTVEKADHPVLKGMQFSSSGTGSALFS
jgi:hypothetical protein